MKLDDLPDDSDRCWHCGADLPDDDRWGLRRYCSPTCRREYHNARKRRERRERRPGRTCVQCGGEISVERDNSTIYCSQRCVVRAYRERQKHAQRRGRICRQCGGPISEARDYRAMYCGERCQDRARRARERASKAGV